MSETAIAAIAKLWAAGEYRTALEQLLQAIDGRAAGAWRRDGNTLDQLGFVAAAAMSRDLAEEFATATRTVPFDRTDLAIVQAMIRQSTFVAQPHDGPRGSAGWLLRFDATASYCVPLKSADSGAKPWGVLAVAGGAELVTDTPRRRIVDELAAVVSAEVPGA